jgi:hypothetical protein
MFQLTTSPQSAAGASGCVCMASGVAHSSRVGVGALALIGCITASAVVSAASNGRLATLDERIAGSQKVVVASARTVEAHWQQNTYGDRLIVSRVLLEVQETLKGTAAGNTIWMELEGGTLDGFTLRVSDLPELKPGERAVFFLDQAANGMTTPHLRGQGILKLGDDDVVLGSRLRLDDIRTGARALR